MIDVNLKKVYNEQFCKYIYHNHSRLGKPDGFWTTYCNIVVKQRPLLPGMKVEVWEYIRTEHVVYDRKRYLNFFQSLDTSIYLVSCHNTVFILILLKQHKILICSIPVFVFLLVVDEATW